MALNRLTGRCRHFWEGLYRLGLDPFALTAMPSVAVNQMDGGNHGACNAGTRRVPRRRSRARHRTDRRISAGHQSPPSLAPTDTWRGADHGGACGSGA
jgi:hypothetical protein